MGILTLASNFENTERRELSKLAQKSDDWAKATEKESDHKFPQTSHNLPRQDRTCRENEE